MCLPLQMREMLDGVVCPKRRSHGVSTGNYELLQIGIIRAVHVEGLDLYARYRRPLAGELCRRGESARVGHDLLVA